MIVEERRGGGSWVGEEDDRFPVGMRVLAVDDDPACLKLLDALLRKCQYDVTTTNQAIKALDMLRENKNRFDLVISDVQMPDMDGFKLLELVGLEMDLPVIMLSAYSETQFVMKGIAHGACDYLLKPVRIEELKNIWQHVIRRRKIVYKDQNKSPNQGRACQGSSEGGLGPIALDTADQDGKHCRKRKEQNEDEEEEEDTGLENEDSTTQKKPRVVWSVDLHRKFVAAVNQLGIDKAFPKRILDLMNVEGLTRENVASHLQKYRLYIKRITSAASQEANMVAALGSKDPAYMHLNALNKFSDFNTLHGSGGLSNNSVPSYLHNGMFGRLNTPCGFSPHRHGFTSGFLPRQAQNSTNCVSTLRKFQHAASPADRKDDIFQGVTTSLGLEQLHQSKCLTQSGEYNQIRNQAVFSAPNGIPDASPRITSSKNSVLGATNNPMLLNGTLQQPINRGGYASQSSLKVASLNHESFGSVVNGSSNILDHEKITENWQSAVELSRFHSDALPHMEHFNNDHLPAKSLGDNFSSTCLDITNNCINFTSTSAVSLSLEDSREDKQCQEGLLSNVVQNIHHITKEHKQDCGYNIYTNGSFNSSVATTDFVGFSSQSLDQNSSICNQKMDMPTGFRLNDNTPSLIQPTEIANSAADTNAKSNKEQLLEQTGSQSHFFQNNSGSLEDLMGPIVTQDHGGMVLIDEEFGIDAYSF